MRSAPIFNAFSMTPSEVMTIWMSSTAMNMPMQSAANPSHLRVSLTGIGATALSVIWALVWTSRQGDPMAHTQL